MIVLSHSFTEVTYANHISEDTPWSKLFTSSNSLRGRCQCHLL